MPRIRLRCPSEDRYNQMTILVRLITWLTAGQNLLALTDGVGNAACSLV